MKRIFLISLSPDLLFGFVAVNEARMKLTLAAAVVLFGSGLTVMAAQTPKPAPAAAPKPAAAPAAKAGPAPVIVLDTAKGVIEIQTFPEDAPKTVEHIAALVKKNFYNGMRFHRAEPGFLVQVGDPQSRDMSQEAWWGWAAAAGRSAWPRSRRSGATTGAVAMAHVGDPEARRQPVLHQSSPVLISTASTPCSAR